LLNEPVWAIEIADLEATGTQIESSDGMAKGYSRLARRTYFFGMGVVKYEIAKEY
jgi:hypothetical protein